MIGTGDMMGYWSVWHWVIFAAVAVATIYPVGRILDRLGFSPFWSILALVPPLNLLGLWVLALSPWPRDRAN